MSADDAARGRALLERICRMSQADPAPTDSDFGNAVRRVGRAMSAGGEDYLVAGVNLAEYLLSDAPLGPGERRELALLVLGAQRPAPHRHRTAHAANPAMVQIVERYREAIAAGAAPKNATAEVCKRFGISEKTLRQYRRLVEEYEKARARNKSLEASLSPKPFASRGEMLLLGCQNLTC